MNFKKFAVLLLVIVTLLTFSGCGNKQFIDLTYEYDRAIIYLPNGTVIEGEIDSWCDYSDGDQLQVKIDGMTYLVHSTNCVLIDD
jgi:hypothetical protein